VKNLASDVQHNKAKGPLQKLAKGSYDYDYTNILHLARKLAFAM